MRKLLHLGFLIPSLVIASIHASDQHPTQDMYLDLDKSAISSCVSSEVKIENAESLNKPIPLEYDAKKDLTYRVFESQEQYDSYRDTSKNLSEKLLTSKDRRKILEDKVYLQPHNCHFYLEMIYKDSPKIGQTTTYYGSGTLIQPNLLLTAAHNLYDHDEIYNYPNQIVCLGACYGNDRLVEASVFPRQNSNSIFVSQNYIDSHPQTAARKSSDIALIILEQETAKSFFHKNLTSVELVTDFSKLTPDLLEKLFFNITGYPGKRIAHTMDGKVTRGRVSNTIHYEIDTTRGQSGSGIWFENKGKVYCVGVHTSFGKRGENFNIGTLCNPELKRIIESNKFNLNYIEGRPLNV
jgi:V8-like Glu-specific endopeptidase